MSEPRQWRTSLERPLTIVIADGMGGHAAGEVASNYVATRIANGGPHIDDAKSVSILLQNINAELYDSMMTDRSLVGMGSTGVGLILIQQRLIWFNVGDSRLYRHRNDFLRQISVDDVPDQMIEGSSARRKSHSITQSFGGMKNIEHIVPHTGMDDFSDSSRWLLCSDGLTDMIDIDTMEACMKNEDAEAVSRLFELAMDAGGEDNISIAVVSIVTDGDTTAHGMARG
jgi:serine/threonine protein phosphatase PrpC